MSVYYMRDSHTFFRLDTLPLQEALELVEKEALADGGYGFIGGRGEHSHLGVFAWRPKELWVQKVQELLTKAGCN